MAPIIVLELCLSNELSVTAFFRLASWPLVTGVLEGDAFPCAGNRSGLIEKFVESEISSRPVMQAAFQIRSSWTQFLRFSIFERLDFSITYVFSIPLNIPTPPPPT